MPTVPTTSDVLLRGARLVDGDAPVDVLLRDGRVAAVGSRAPRRRRRGPARRPVGHARPLGRARAPDAVGARAPAARRLRRDLRRARRRARRRPHRDRRRRRGRPSSASGSATGSGPTCRRPRSSTPPSATCPSSWSRGTCTAPGPRRRGCGSSASVRTPPASCARPSGSRCRRSSTTSRTTSPTSSSTTPAPPPPRGGSSGWSTWSSPTTSRSGVAGSPRAPRGCACGRASGRSSSTAWSARTCTPATLAGLVSQGPLKVITDGSLNTRTAYCHDPYEGVTGPHAHGVLAVPPSRLAPLMAHATRHGCAARSTPSATPRTPWPSTPSRRPVPPGRSSTPSW